ncbi:feather beta keratin-like [Apteryx mantelli]|uniref:Keratin n=1 Tax=Apteryx mantelli TaxID=2696672 RepID=A0ABM4E7L0_9AVES
MACYDLCSPCGPTPLANSCSEPCVRQCEHSRIAIQPPTLLVTLPGPILTSFPQNTALGSTTAAALGDALAAQGVPISSGRFTFGDLSCFPCGRGCNPC